MYKRVKIVIVVHLFLLSTFVVLISYLPNQENSETFKTKRSSGKGLKTILFWNTLYGEKEYVIGEGHDQFATYDCPETRCYTTSNRSFLPNIEDFDALLIHERGIKLDDLPKARSPHQRFEVWLVSSIL